MPAGRGVAVPTTVAGGLLRLARQKADLSQRELAERAGVTPSMVARYETGQVEPTLPALLRLLHAAGFELHMHLEPYDRHDETLAWQQAQLAPSERRRWRREQDAKVAAARRRWQAR